MGAPCRTPLARLQGLGLRISPQSLRASARVSSRRDFSNGIPCSGSGSPAVIYTRWLVRSKTVG